PLTSLRSAVETVARVEDPDQQKRLMTIILEDVGRLDRLISDISDASRLDAELSREVGEEVDIGVLLKTLVEVHEVPNLYDEAAVGPKFRLHLPKRDRLIVQGLEGRLGQVFRNIISNAITFNPPGGTITLSAARRGSNIRITVEDEGPGLPEGKFAAVFNRFYTERPAAEKFGTHSGLGLSISKQVVDAHGGVIRAENRLAPDGTVLGARFIVTLPTD
ncbi:MAG TPA: ATP-binding protein, partial [Kiloniellaceae bacterium]|nr:ATP-binding protein [Kiloniellaceae bacterium]